MRKVLVIGSGGREHALAWAAARSPEVAEVLVAPGNAGTAQEPKVRNVALDPMDFPGLSALAKDEGVALTIVGPEAPLVAGVVDTLEGRLAPALAPAAAQLRALRLLPASARHGIPTADMRFLTPRSGRRTCVPRVLPS